MKILYAGGTFDLFHYGHMNFLRQCSELSEKVVVSLNTDEFVEEYKGAAPVIRYRARRAALLTCTWVDAVVKNVGGPDSKPSIEVVAPDIVAVGDDWKSRDYHAQMMFSAEWLEERGIELIYLPYTDGISSTALRRGLSRRTNERS